MNITINKGGKEYEFKYSVEKPEISKGAQKHLSFHKWNCSELPESEVFFGEYDNSGATKESLKEKAERFINELPQIKSIVEVAEAPVEEVIEPMIEEEVNAEATEEEVVDEPTIEEFTEIEEPKEEGFFTKLKNKLTNN